MSSITTRFGEAVKVMVVKVKKMRGGMRLKGMATMGERMALNLESHECLDLN